MGFQFESVCFAILNSALKDSSSFCSWSLLLLITIVDMTEGSLEAIIAREWSLCVLSSMKDIEASLLDDRENI